MSDDELSGDWPSLLRIALSQLGGLSQLKFWDAKNKLRGRVIEHQVWIESEELQQRPCWSVKVEATHKSPFDALQDAAILAVITMRLHFPREFQDTPFMVLPMVPGQRSRLDYPAVGGGAVAATSMGVDSKDVERLQRKCFTSYFRERHEYCDRLREHNLKIWQLIADYSNLAEEFILCPTRMPEMLRRKAELSKRSDDMWVVPDRCCARRLWLVCVHFKQGAATERGTVDEAIGGWDAAADISNCSLVQGQAVSEMHAPVSVDQ